MIKVKFEINPETSLIKLTVKGHANYAEKGKDIVCASATILSYTVAQVILELNVKGFLQHKPKIQLQEGNIAISCKPKAEAFDEVIHTFLVAQTGFALLHKSYNKYINVKCFGC